MGTNYQKLFYKDYEQLYEQNNKLSEELRRLTSRFSNKDVKLQKEKMSV